MKKWLLKIVFGLVGVAALLFGYKQWGKATEKKKQAEAIAKQRKKDAKISANYFIDKPFSKLRRKK